MLAEIVTGVNSLKAAKDIVQGLSAIKTEVAINEARISLQGHILEAQQALFAAQQAETATTQRIGDLEQQIVRLKDWTAEKERYELKSLGRGSFAYMLKPKMRGAEPPHWLCTRCFEDGQKSIMQGQGRAKEPRDGIHGCPRCKATLTVRHWTVPAYDAAPEE